MCLAYLTQYDNLYAHTCCCKWHYFVLYYSWIIFHCIFDGHLGCFHVQAIVKCATVNTRIHVSFQIMVFSRYLPKDGIVMSYGTFIFSFLREFHSVHHSGYTNLDSQQECRRVPFSPHPFQHLSFASTKWPFWWWPFWQVSLDFPLLPSNPLWWIGHLFFHVSSRKSCRSS